MDMDEDEIQCNFDAQEQSSHQYYCHGKTPGLLT